MQSVETALRGQVRTRFGLLLTACGTLQVSGHTTALLNQVFGFDAAHRRLVVETDPSVLVCVPVTRRGGRPATHADRIKAIIADRAANGRTASGMNAEIRAIQAEYKAKFSSDHPPVHTTVMRYLPK